MFADHIMRRQRKELGLLTVPSHLEQDHQAPLGTGPGPPDQLCFWRALLPARPVRADSAYSCIFASHAACLDYACTLLPGLAQLLGTPPHTLQVKLMTLQEAEFREITVFRRKNRTKLVL